MLPLSARKGCNRQGSFSVELEQLSPLSLSLSLETNEKFLAGNTAALSLSAQERVGGWIHSLASRQGGESVEHAARRIFDGGRNHMTLLRGEGMRAVHVGTSHVISMMIITMAAAAAACVVRRPGCVHNARACVRVASNDVRVVRKWKWSRVSRQRPYWIVTNDIIARWSTW